VVVLGIDGTWSAGAWFGGVWKSGMLEDSNREGNYDECWDWYGNSVRSLIPFKEYWLGVEHEKE